jgi:hypothetical protein
VRGQSLVKTASFFVSGLVAIGLVVMRPARAHAGPKAHATAERIDVGPVIDGRFDDATWQNVPWVDHFTQIQPDQGASPSEKTAFRVAYDDAHVYVAVSCFDSNPTGIVSRLTRRDRDIEADWVSVSFDSRNDGASAFLFQLSAAGVQVDGQVFNNTDFSGDWDAVWSGAVARDDQGWHAEFAIPLTVLRFSAADVQSWGLQVHRNISRKREQVMWSYEPESGETWGVSRFGVIDGLRGLRPRRAFEIRPYVMTRIEARDAEGGGELGLSAGSETRGRYAIGADAKIGLTSRLTLDVSLNPDFGQVEADQVVLNLSRFESFFPEKRPFFLEGRDLFATTINLFYPRRIGRPSVGLGPGDGVLVGERNLAVTRSDGSLRLWTAAKVTGEVGDGLSIGVLGAVTGAEVVDAVDDGGQSESVTLAPPRAYGVVRGRYGLGGGSFVGLMGTSVTRLGEDTVYRASQDHDAYTQAADFSFMSASGRFRTEAQLALSERVGGPAYQLGDGRACSEAESAADPGCVPIVRADGTRMGPGAIGAGLQVRSRYSTRSRFIRFESTSHTAKFDPNDAGFAPRFNLNEFKVVGGFMDRDPGAVFNFVGLFPFVVASVAMDGTPQYGLIGADFEATFKNNVYASPEQWLLAPGTFDIYEAPGGARFENVAGWEGHLDASTNQAKALSAYGRMNWFLGLDGEQNSLGGAVGLNWQAASNLELGVEPEVGIDRATRFYDCEAQSGRSCLVDMGLRRYRFATLDSRYFSLTARGTYTVATPLSIQFYAQWFMAEGEFSNYREIDTMGEHPEIRRDALRPSNEDGDVDGDGQPDDGFEAASLNVNLVLRWEPAPGSTLFAVYTRAQESPVATPGQLHRGPTEDVILLKLVYYVD